MKTKLIKIALITLALVLATLEPAAAQNVSTSSSTSNGSPTRTDRSIEYHDGPVLLDTPVIYFIWYGDWSASTQTQVILSDFAAALGSTPYFQINEGYPINGGAQYPTGSLLFGGAGLDLYSHGQALTEADVADVVAQQVTTGGLPLDTVGIYVVLTSPDVTVIDGTTRFCLTCCNLHGHSVANGSPFRWVFVGSPVRCPSACSPQSQSPNSTYELGSYEADAMATWLAAALSEVVTDPNDNAWYDRYGLENAEKCEGTYGETYTVTNPAGQLANANIKLGNRHYLIQQNWVNGKKGHCAMSYLQ